MFRSLLVGTIAAISIGVGGSWADLGGSRALLASSECGNHAGPLCRVVRSCKLVYLNWPIYVPVCEEIWEFYPNPNSGGEPKEDEEIAE